MPDYYNILGVSPTADILTIKKAYKSRARECHPDRGGSHDEMVAVNEAWEVLSDASLRLQYDRWRSSQQQKRARSPVPDVDKARQRAQSYEKDWSSFEKWIDSLRDDILQAKYDRKEFANLEYDSVSNSKSGRLFAAGGALLGVIGGALIFWYFKPEPIHRDGLIWSSQKTVEYQTNALWPGRSISEKKSATPPQIHFRAPWIFVFLAMFGASIGAKAHRIIGRLILGAPNVAEPQPAQPMSDERILACPHCGQKLRLREMTGGRRVKCRKCDGTFESV